MIDTPLPGFTTRYPGRDEMQAKAATLRDLLKICDLAQDQGGDLARLSCVLLPIATAYADQLNNALDSINAPKELEQ